MVVGLATGVTSSSGLSWLALAVTFRVGGWLNRRSCQPGKAVLLPSKIKVSVSLALNFLFLFLLLAYWLTHLVKFRLGLGFCSVWAEREGLPPNHKLSKRIKPLPLLLLLLLLLLVLTFPRP